MPDEVTIGELYRLMQGMEKRVNDAILAINGKFESLQFVHKETHNIQFNSLSDRVEELEERNKWIARTFVAAFIFPVLVATIVALLISK